MNAVADPGESASVFFGGKMTPQRPVCFRVQWESGITRYQSAIV